jgi:hypothetical protein
VAKAAGFSNVHDYLVFEKTGESVDAIASRKDEKGWVNGDTHTWSGSKEELETGSGEMIEVDVPDAKAQRTVWPKQHLKRKGTECKVFDFSFQHFRSLMPIRSLNSVGSSLVSIVRSVGLCLQLVCIILL